MKEGHFAAACENDMVCLERRKLRNMRGDTSCQAVTGAPKAPQDHALHDREAIVDSSNSNSTETESDRKKEEDNVMDATGENAAPAATISEGENATQENMNSAAPTCTSAEGVIAP